MDTEGDSLVAEFDSIVDAVRCAAKIQEEVRVRNAALSEGRRIEFRIGISLGDVIQDEKAAYGDVVNIAGGLKALAEVGEICISEKAYDEVKDKLPLGYEQLGKRSLRNVAEPVNVYKVLMKPKLAGKVVGEKKERPRAWRRVAVAVFLLALMVGALAFWYFYLRPAPVEIASTERTEIPQPDKPSIDKERERLKEEWWKWRKKSDEFDDEMKKLKDDRRKYDEKAQEIEVRIKTTEEELEKLKKERELEKKRRVEAERLRLEEQETRKRRAEAERLRREQEEKEALEQEAKSLKLEKELERMRKAEKQRLKKERAKIAALEKKMESLEREKEIEKKRRLEQKKKEELAEEKAREVKESRDKSLAYIPKEKKEPEIRRIRLRSTPRPTWDSDIKEMIKKHNFYVKGQNERGNFPNHFVDNQDGTVTDLATGLMWEKGGSSSAIFYQGAEEYVVRLNERKYRGYNDWRIPTTEELASLLEPVTNKATGLHIGPLFAWKQEQCWSSDRHADSPGRGIHNRTVDFYAGSIDKRIAIHGDLEIERSFIKAVRSIHRREAASVRGQDNRLAYIPKPVKKPKKIRAQLRSDPKEIHDSDVEKVITKYGFFVKYVNESGAFQNDFLDNGDGTVTDRVTGLMWEKGGSSSAVRYADAQQHVSRLNKEKFLGYEDWRIPTLEELCSLLEPKLNDKGQHINALFDSRQRACWSGDYRDAIPSFPGINWYYTVDFSSGRVSAGFGPHPTHFDDFCFIRAVRSIVKKPKKIRVKLRSEPKAIWDSDIEEMIIKHNFFARYRNEGGSFRNDFADNGDGTVTDRVTGLMWEKGGSSSAMRYWNAKRYVSRLNKERFSGYRDWRIPTTEELASLLERDRNNKGLHISSDFGGRQKECWTSDTAPSSAPGLTFNNAIDFFDGSIDLTKKSQSSAPNLSGYEPDECFIRGVRSIK
jgi:hypothetical protein